MIAPPAMRAPTSISAAAQVRALELSVLVSPANGSCAKARALDSSTAPSSTPTTRVRVRRLPMGILPFAGGCLQAATHTPSPVLFGLSGCRRRVHQQGPLLRSERWFTALSDLIRGRYSGGPLGTGYADWRGLSAIGGQEAKT